MSYDWLRLEHELAGLQPPARHVLYSVQGTGAPWDFGYPADIARVLNDEHWAWQGISYGPGGIPQAIPMQPSITDGGNELARQIRLRPPSQTWGFISYSQGAIVTADIMDRCGITHNPKVKPDLAEYADSFIGGVTFGNPRREEGHTLPGGIDPGGHGIVLPQSVGTPESVWDFAAGKHMPGSPGQDLYTTSGYRGDHFTEEDEEAVWEIVRHGTLNSAIPLVKQVVELLQNPMPAAIGAGIAILDALDFFLIEGITPHTSYHLIQPIPGDQRTCWQLAYDHLTDLGVNVPAHS